MKPKLLIIELWGLGDLVIATPFIRAVAEKFAITLLAKPYALDLQPRLWPGVQVIKFTAPWTAFTRKYHFWRWPWWEMLRLYRRLRAERFEFGLSARWDPRDHLLLKLFGVRNRLGFPRLQSQIFLTQLLVRPEPEAHRYEYWHATGKAMGIELPPRGRIAAPIPTDRHLALVHSGARLPARVWPLEHYRTVVQRLRANGFAVQVACDPNQLDWWQQSGETTVACPRTVTQLLSLIDQAGAFIGNCSGPGHLAAINGVPTFTIFGPSLLEWFAPLHPAAEWIEGKPCPYKPCSDYCRFAAPHCLWNVTEEEVWTRVEKFAAAHLRIGERRPESLPRSRS